MSNKRNRDVLYEFAMEDDHVSVLPDYQREFPEWADELEDLAVDLAKDDCE